MVQPSTAVIVSHVVASENWSHNLALYVIHWHNPSNDDPQPFKFLEETSSAVMQVQAPQLQAFPCLQNGEADNSKHMETGGSTVHGVGTWELVLTQVQC